jgi:hypothetical protein
MGRGKGAGTIHSTRYLKEDSIDLTSHAGESERPGSNNEEVETWDTLMGSVNVYPFSNRSGARESTYRECSDGSPVRSRTIMSTRDRQSRRKILPD